LGKSGAGAVDKKVGGLAARPRDHEVVEAETPDRCPEAAALVSTPVVYEIPVTEVLR
jgi:hypothetical protein